MKTSKPDVRAEHEQDTAPEYDVRRAVRGKHYRRGRTHSHVTIRYEDGTCVEGDMVYLALRSGECGVDLCLRVIRREWPDAVFVSPHDHHPVEDWRTLNQIGMVEVFVLRDRECAKRVRGREDLPDLGSVWIRLELTEGGLGLVVPNALDAASQRIIGALRDAQRTDVFKQCPLGSAAQ